MATHIRKNDVVEVVSGDHRGARGKVLRVDLKRRLGTVQHRDRTLSNAARTLSSICGRSSETATPSLLHMSTRRSESA